MICTSGEQLKLHVHTFDPRTDVPVFDDRVVVETRDPRTLAVRDDEFSLRDPPTIELANHGALTSVRISSPAGRSRDGLMPSRAGANALEALLEQLQES
jgi:hypothetical protein